MGLLQILRNHRTEQAPEKAKDVSVADVMSQLELTIVAVADLHSCFREDMEAIRNALEKYRHDCVLLLGDIFAEDVREISSCTPAPCYYVLGNHDYWGQNNSVSRATDLDSVVVSVNGIRIGGIGAGVKYKPGNYAMRTQEEVYAATEKLGETDILISHESPYHLLNTNTSHSGFQAISDYVAEKKPKLHLFGHHHIREERMIGETKEVCIYQCAILSPDGIRYIL